MPDPLSLDYERLVLEAIPWWVWVALGAGFVFQVLRALFGARVKGHAGEARVRRALRRLDAAAYTSFHDLYVRRPDGKGTTQIDHVVVSEFGVFVIETKNYQGWIFGGTEQPKWTQSIYGKKSQFQNPLHQNALHIRALAIFLDLPPDRFHSVVYFAGDSTFKTDLPPNVIDRGLVKYIQTFQSPLLSHEEANHCRHRLAELDKSTNRRRAGREHTEAVRGRGRRE